jgi:hypothetical protein
MFPSQLKRQEKGASLENTVSLVGPIHHIYLTTKQVHCLLKNFVSIKILCLDPLYTSKIKNKSFNINSFHALEAFATTYLVISDMRTSNNL